MWNLQICKGGPEEARRRVILGVQVRRGEASWGGKRPDRSAGNGGQVKDGLEEAELAATWNQRKRKRRGTEDRIFQNEILRIASIVSMYKILQYLTLEWHRFIKNIFQNSCTETSFYPSTSTITQWPQDRISLPPHSSASLKLSFWDLTSPHILGWIFATCTFWHLYQSGLFFETRVFKFYNLVNHLVTVVTETSCHQLVAKDHPDSFAGQAAVHTAEVVFKAKFCPKSNLGVS